jgi:hypothetical protein
VGLLPTQGAPYADPNAPAPDAQAQPQDEQPNVSPEEQQIYDQVVGKAADIIYGKGKVMPEIVEALKPAKGTPTGEGEEDQAQPEGQGKVGNPAVLALANTAVQIVQKLDVAAKDAGQPIPDDVLYHAGSEVVEMLAEVAEAAGFHDYSEEEINGAFLQAVDLYRPIAEEMGRTSSDQLKQQFGEIEQADQQGQLGQLLPGIDQGTQEQPQ